MFFTVIQQKYGESLDAATIGTSIANSLTNAGLPAFFSFLCSFSLLLAVELILLISFAKLLRSTIQTAFKAAFHKRYHIVLNKAVILRLTTSIKEQGDVTLRIPFWKYENKDGSRNKRKRNNRLIRRESSLAISHFVITSNNPYLIYWLYKELILRGVQFLKPKIFGRKGRICPDSQGLRLASRPASNASSVIYAHYIDHPTDFEEYCAEIFRQQGYKAKTTPRTNDGGFDIDMIDPQGRRCIVECKCYNPDNESVGRDLIQKLVGANAVVQAERLIFITTARFTEAATKYACSISNPVELIDGDRLQLIIRRETETDTIGTNTSETAYDQIASLISWKEIAKHYPPDVGSRA